MIKILHSADWHLDAPMRGHSESESAYLRQELSKLPQKICKLCSQEQCDLLLLSGDLFDGKATPVTVKAVQRALEEVRIPVLIAPGNHDCVTPDSPYAQPGWPENVHIFKEAKMQSIAFPALDLCVHGAGYEAMDCPALLKGFHADGGETWQIGVLHGEMEGSNTPYCPISREQLRNSNLQYLALGHIHKGGSLRTGNSLCAWPGCPMGRGFDELGAKGVILVTLDETVQAAFIPIDTPRFYDEEVVVGESAHSALANILPALESQDFYRVTFTGYCTPIELDSLYSAFSHIPHLTLRDNTLPEQDLWGTADEDSLEGVFFSMLQQASRDENPVKQERAKLAARIARQILDGQEVKLP